MFKRYTSAIFYEIYFQYEYRELNEDMINFPSSKQIKVQNNLISYYY